MRVNSSKKVMSIPRGLVEVEGGVVVLSLKEYRHLLENTVPAVYLKGRRARALDRLVTQGLEDHMHGRTRKIDSLADLDE
jgi:hypothetical protein